MTKRVLSVLALVALLGACEALESGEKLPASAIEPTLKEAVAEAEQAQDYMSAANYYRSLYERNPTDLATILPYARSLRLVGLSEEAIEVLAPLVEANPKHTGLLFELAKNQIGAAKPAEAVPSLKKLVGMEKRLWEGWSALGIAYDYLGQSAEAQERYLQALSISPENPVVLNNLALSQARTGALPIAIATLERAARHPRARAQVRQNLAMLLALKGDAGQAERLVRQDLPPDIAG
ncbi:MAG: tetratricopeptide repeat protein, partial [Rhodospirillales bacterium]|nr:tetratricopeptide repeat protein [Rhodospirillales bacterium]